MKKVLLFFFFAFLVLSGYAQIQTRTGGNRGNMGDQNNMFQTDSTQFKGEIDVKIEGDVHFTDYKLISIFNDTTYIDTTLTIYKDRILNYNRKDDFEMLGFHNQGQTFNKLAQTFSGKGLFPAMGFYAKQHNYLRVGEIPFYHVPTPSSELMYRTGLEQGQVLDAMVTMNTSEQFNFSLAYKGLRSLGKYRHALASHGNFRATFNYQSINQGYILRGQFYSYDFLNNENGGLTPASIDLFESNDPNYVDRGRLEVNFSNAENMFEGKRYYLEQRYAVVSRKNAAIKHNKEVAEQLQEYNDLLLEIESLETGKTIDELKKEKARNSAIAKSKPKTANPTDTTQEKPAIANRRDSLKTRAVIPKDSLALRTVSTPIDSIQNDSTRIQPKEISVALEDTLNLKETVETVIDSLKPSPRILTDSIKMKLDSLNFLATSKKIDSSFFIEVPKKEPFRIDLGHILQYETTHYRFDQTEALSDFYGEAYESSIEDHTAFKKMNNEAYVGFSAPYLGSLRFKGGLYDYNYHYNSILFFDDNTIADKLKGNALSVGADWSTQFGKVFLKADASSILSGDLEGHSIRAMAEIKKDSVYSFQGFAEMNARAPDFNKMLFQSDYVDYNWQNNFSNEELKNIGVAFKLDKWGSVSASYNLVDNYTYFNEDSKPIQATETLTYLKVKAHQYFTYRNFTIDNTVMYQVVSEGEDFFHVPELITRNSLYYSNYVFKGDPLYLQTGFTFKYFTAFKMNAYNPLISEFVLQNEEEIGAFPIVDFFLNLQVQRTRIFLKVENFTGAFTGRNYYAAPNYPYRDLTIRFGLVWNWFI